MFSPAPPANLPALYGQQAPETVRVKRGSSIVDYKIEFNIGGEQMRPVEFVNFHVSAAGSSLITPGIVANLTRRELAALQQQQVSIPTPNTLARFSPTPNR